MANISIKSKLLIMLLSVSALSIAAVATLGYRESYQALQSAVFSHLTSIRASRADALESYIGSISSELEVLASSGNIGEISKTFNDAVRELETLELQPEQLAQLESLYRTEYLPKLDEMVDGTPEFLSVFPEASPARYLQYHYLAANPYPVENRLQLDDAGDESGYSAFHEETHPILRRIAVGFGYQDLFLIDINSGVIVYSTTKEVDFGTSLINGPHATSNLGRLFRMIQRNPDRGAARLIDFEHYRPSYGMPAMFLAAPVFLDGRPVGVVAARESTGDLDRVITGNQQWERDGLGMTGETVVIGPDLTLRSASRFFIEDPEGYVMDQRAIGTSEQVISRILEMGSPILEQEVRSEAAQQAVRGQSGTGVLTDYRGQEILGSWAPLQIKDLDWAIVGKVDLAEAYAPIHQLAKNTLIQTVIILMVITLVVMVLATSFVRPMNDLVSRVQRFGAGDHEVDFEGTSADEIGDLTQSFRELVESARTQTRLIEEVTRENERLLGNILPRRLAQQVRQGSAEQHETVLEVSVIFSELRGLAELSQKRSPAECVSVLREYLAAADEAGGNHQAERIKTMGDTYMAAVGLSAPLLNHVQRAVKYARELRSAVARIAQMEDAELELIVGISSGPVITNVVHQEELLFQLWGEAVINADYARDHAEPGQIVVTDSVRAALAEKYRFTAVHNQRQPALWLLEDA
jgi:class 3 adenylate cyclase